MKTALIAKFQTANEIQRAETNLYKLIQGNNTVQVYTAEFTKWSMQIPNLEEGEMYRCLYRGLSWKIQDKVNKRKHFIKNLTNLQTEASSIDDTLRRRLERPSSFKPQFRTQNERPHYPNKSFPKKNFHQVDKTTITCYKCGKKGHIKSECYSSASNSK